MQPPPQRPCRFQMNCRDFAQGNCRFFHGDTGNMPEQPRGGNYRGRDNYDRPRGGRGGFQNGRNQGYQEGQQGRNQGGRGYQGNSNHGSQEHSGRGGYQGGYQGGNQGGYQGGNQGGYQGKNQGGYQGGNQVGNQRGYQGNNSSQGPQGKIGGDNINQQFCRSYQLNGECQHGDRCNRKHGFTFDDNIRRLQFLRNIPSELQCKLTAFFALEKNYISLRNGNQVTFCEYDIEGSIFNEVGKWSLPNPTIKYHYFTQKGSFIYFASENPKSAYVDLGFYDIFTKKMFIIENGHQNKITGMAHFINGVLLSASLDGDLKVWKLEGDKYVVDKPSTERLKSQYNPMNTKTELMFVNVDEMLGTTIISCGTSNNRLFLFIGTELIYKQVIFDQQYSKIYEVRFLQLNGQAAALVLAWNHNSTASAILGISLTDFMQTPLIEVQTDQDKPKLNIRLFEVLDDHLFVANGHGFVTIYRLPDFKTKVGCINHQNALSGIVMVKGEIKTTSIMARHMFILETKQQNNEGSLGVYLLKL